MRRGKRLRGYGLALKCATKGNGEFLPPPSSFLFRVVAKSSVGHAMPHRLKYLELRNLSKPPTPLKSVNVRLASNPAVFISNL
jgi:hypothetical protein